MNNRSRRKMDINNILKENDDDNVSEVSVKHKSNFAGTGMYT